jgi:rare lipoprotein A
MRQRKSRVVVCLGAFAASAFLANEALACGERASAEADETEITTAELPAPASAKLAVMALQNPERDLAVNSDQIRNSFSVPIGEPIIGVASFYDDPQTTASGEPFVPAAFTAAAQLKIRDKFGGIRFGTKYQPAFAVAEYQGKKIILKFNDVGPLRPGRKFDLSRAAMAYFDGLEKGLLSDLKVTPLPLGQIYVPGPITDAQMLALGIGDMGLGFATAQAPVASEQSILDSRAVISPPPAEQPRETVSPLAGEIAGRPDVES